jgi:hypothetical protein
LKRSQYIVIHGLIVNSELSQCRGLFKEVGESGAWIKPPEVECTLRGYEFLGQCERCVSIGKGKNYLCHAIQSPEVSGFVVMLPGGNDSHVDEAVDQGQDYDYSKQSFRMLGDSLGSQMNVTHLFQGP